jgi:hypothetical protein
MPLRVTVVVPPRGPSVNSSSSSFIGQVIPVILLFLDIIWRAAVS